MNLTIRFWLIVLVMLLAIVGLVWRIVDLMIFNRHFLLDQGDARSLRVVSIPAYRGMILDRNGKPLAISTPVDSIWVDPQEVAITNEQIKKLARLLNLGATTLKKLIAENKNREFVYLKRDVYPYLGQQVKELNIPGVYIQREFRRYYPEGEVAAQLIGITNIDDQGQEGIELEHNDWLAGSPGKKRVLKDRLGGIVENVDLIKPAEPGHDLVLSIDRRIQFLAYRELKETIEKYHALSGSIVVLDAKTGEVLAMANQPSFNPNNRPENHDSRYRNRAVTDVFEPGSTVKAFSVANALASNKYTPDTIINTEPGYIYVEGKKVKDISDHGVLTVTGVLQKSSNVGVTKITLTLPPQSLWELLHDIGFGERTDTGFPGESPGVLVKYQTWRPFVLATLSFGYGLSVTNLQLAQAYSVLASGGYKRAISLLRENTVNPGQLVLNTEIAKQILAMMQSVVEQGGTATLAKIPGYHVSGKTGTARIVGPNGYEKDHHIAIFVGVAPVSNPRLVISVVINDPQGQYYAGLVAAPVFARVMSGSLRILDVPPDNITNTVSVKENIQNIHFSED